MSLSCLQINNSSSSLAQIFSSVKAVFVKVKFDRAGTNDKPTVFTIMIEDSADATNICSFGADAERLRNAIKGHEVYHESDIVIIS